MENPWLLLVGLCVQRAVAERETQMRFVTLLSVCISCDCMNMWLVLLRLILLTGFSQQGSLVSGGGQWADHVPRGCSRLINISRRWGWARHLPGGWPDGGPWGTGGKWTQICAALAHAPIPDLTFILSLLSILFLFLCYPATGSILCRENQCC